MILVLSFLISMLTVFAYADEEVEDTEEETEEEKKDETFQLLYNRTYDDGWGISNGMSYTPNGSMATTFNIEYETTLEYDYNYFWRLEIGATANSFVQLSPAYSAARVGAVLEFDIKTDDICNMYNVVNFGTIGDTAASRSDYQLLSVWNNEIIILRDGDYMGFQTEENKLPIGTLGNEWMTFKFVFDYEYVHVPILETDSEEVIHEKTLENNKWFQLYVYYGPAGSNEELTLWNDGPVVLQGLSGKGMQLFRFQASGAKEENFGTSLCFDNLKLYTGVNQLVEITPDMGYGLLVDEFAAQTETILGGNAAAADNAFSKALAMKIGVDYCYYNSKRTAIALDQDGNAYGAPVIKDGKTYVDLATVLAYLGYPYYVHPDGMYIDVSTGVSATYLVVGKDTATVGGETVQLSNAPGYVTDHNGKSYLAITLEDVERLFPGVYGDYDDMGLILIGSAPNLLDRSVNMKSMVETMKKFVFDLKSGEEIYEDVKINTNNFEHPYLYGGPDAVATVRSEYLALLENEEQYLEWDDTYSGNSSDYPEDFWLWVHYVRLINNANSGYQLYALPSDVKVVVDESGEEKVTNVYDTFVGLSGDSTRRSSYSLAQPYMGGTANGYDVGGRSDITNRTAYLEYMAIGYVITEDIKYLQCAYEVALELGEWTHWGPGHFLNCADSSSDFATYFDLTYNGYKKLAAAGITRANGEAYDTDVLATILYEKGVEMGYLSTFYYGKSDENGTPYAELFAPYLSPVVGLGGSYYSERDNNWHAVCVSGMTAASLAIMGEGNGAFSYKCSNLISENLKSLTKLGLDIYAPDGSYIEGPGYWNYGTNSFFKLCMMLDSAAGTDYGLMDTWGIDKTCYYACHTESSDGRTFNFHDGSMSGQDTSYFFYVAQTFNDATLYDVRFNQINGNLKNAKFEDLIFYPRDVKFDSDDVQLDYMPDSNDVFATRSGWESGSLYAAIAGGTNKLGHGQIDAGSFVYHNAGNVWIIDLGTENYNCEGFWPAATRYRFYVMKPEGNNTVAISSDVTNVPYGQILDSNAPAIASGSNEYGAYVVYNMKDTLGARASYWTRGMLLTNDRKTTIIQDQLTLDSMQNVYWFAHYIYQGRYINNYGVENVIISADGRTAYLQRYRGMDEHQQEIFETLRLTLLSDNPSFKFTIMDTYTTIHTDPITGTYQKGYIETQGSGVPENDRSNYKKLAISSGKVLKFDVAVVIEMVDTNTINTPDEIDVGYKFTNMTEWEPTADMRGLEGDVVTIERRGKPNISKHIVTGLNLADSYVKSSNAYGLMIALYYRAVTDAYYAIRMLGSDLPAEYKDHKDVLKVHREEFTLYKNELNAIGSANTELMYQLMGLK